MTERHSAISRRLSRSARLGLCWLALAVMAGCGATAEPRGRVSGKVTFQKKPVTEGIVAFANAEKAVYMNANIKADGSYKLLAAKGPGLPVGEYQVAVSPPTQDFQTGPVERANRKQFPNIPQKYRDPKTSGLKLTVKAGENPSFDIDMK
jgi:hypothetical protein